MVENMKGEASFLNFLLELESEWLLGGVWMNYVVCMGFVLGRDFLFFGIGFWGKISCRENVWFV